MSDKLHWWAYLHTNGSIQVKRYFDKQDIDDAWESPFVKDVFATFQASDRKEAIEMAAEYFTIDLEKDDDTEL